MNIRPQNLPRNIALWSRYLFHRYVRRVGIDSPPAFIMACGHSGTTLLLRILGAHSRIFPIPFETELCLKGDEKRMLRNFDRLAISEGKKRWIEKTPRHIQYIDRLLEIRPDARILIILRDGRDVARSIQERKGDIEAGIKRWVEDNRAGQAFWQHPSVYVLRYEQMIDDFESTISAALGFLGEEYEPDMREYHRVPKKVYPRRMNKPPDASGRDHDQYRNWQVNQPLFDGRGKWMKMTAEEKQIVKSHANDMLIEYGYVDSEDW